IQSFIAFGELTNNSGSFICYLLIVFVIAGPIMENDTHHPLSDLVPKLLITAG
ncbi:unnamed protein product, partial [Hymenolepis diminuta]